MSGKSGTAGNPTLKHASIHPHQMSNKPLIITSPLNKSKQDVFSQTGKLNAQLDADIMLDDSS